ncbi:MAG: FG-GAP-like repeat-containing protein [Terriglobales bacterium]
MKRTLLLLLLAMAVLAAAPQAPTPRSVARRTALPADPVTEARRLNTLGVGYMTQQRFEQALGLFEKAYKLDPKLLTARLNAGIALYNLQRYEPAVKALTEVTEKQPTNIRAWYNLGLMLRNQGDSERALAAFTRAAELDPNDADSHYFAGWMAGQLQKHDQAIAAYERALERNPFHVSAEFGLARSHQRTGATEKAREHLARFQKLTQEKLGSPISLAYGDQGKYSLAEDVTTAPDSAPAAIPVRFVSATQQAGLRFEHLAGFSAPRVFNDDAPWVNDASEVRLGPGACFLDYNADGEPDLFLLASGKPGGKPWSSAEPKLLRNAGAGRFLDASNASGLELPRIAQSCTTGDYDNDGKTDLAVSSWGTIQLFRNLGRGKFQDVSHAAGVSTVMLAGDRVGVGLFVGLTFVDYDHDGDLDLFAVRFVGVPVRDPSKPNEFPEASAAIFGNTLWRNNGNGTFTDVTEATGLAGSGSGLAAVLTDFNNDRAVDLLVTGSGPAPTIFANPREGKFAALNPWSEPVPSPSVGVAVFDFNKDGWMDLALTHWAAPGLTLWRNVDGRKLERVPLPALDWTIGWGVAAFDYDNDGWIDLVAVGDRATAPSSTSGRLDLEKLRATLRTKESPEGPRVRLLRNLGPKGFADVTADVGLDKLKLERPRALLTADYDSDGDTDLLITQNLGPVVLLRNDGGNRNSWLRIALRGLNDNKSAIGTKVEVFAGRQWQKWEVPGASGYLGQSAPEIIAGLHRAREADVVRMLWPTGVIQDELQLARRRTHTLDEMDRRGSSCPVLFAWNGERYEFVSDMIGAGIVGHWVGPGVRNTSDPTEYLKVPGTMLKPRNGRLSFRFVEPMEETIYLDQVRLLAVDHPRESDVYPLEHFRIGPPFVPFEVVSSQNAQPPRGAWDDRGRSVLSKVLHRDRRYVTGFRDQAFKGFAEPHYLELDLGEPYQSGPLRLLLHGFIEYFTATSVYAAHQAGVHAVVPYIEAQDASGRWVRAVDQMGFPAGLARTMVTDLSGRLPAGTRRIRIGTNLKIFWDQVLIDRTADQPPVRLHEVPLATAKLAFLGYPRMVEGTPPSDLEFRYQEVSRTGPYTRHPGTYTRYGNVHELLSAPEDKYVILGSGDEVALDFDPASLPPLPEGWTRDYFFFADGFTKDMDFYEAYGLTVAPLPFHDMGSYPYPETTSYPMDPGSLDYLLNYNTRHDSGRPAAGYRFQY